MNPREIEELERLHREWEMAKPSHDRAEKWEALAAAAINALTALLTSHKAMTEALEPFGRLATEWENGHPKSLPDLPDTDTVPGKWITLGQLRLARSALQGVS